MAALALLAPLSRGVGAHDVPYDVTLQSYLRPEGQRLRLLARVPLIALRDITWPFRAPDVLDVSRATSALTDAATLWIGDEATMYENDRALPAPIVVAVRATLPADRSFESYDQALALTTGPPASSTDDITVREGFLDVVFEYPIASESSRFSIAPRWGRLGVRVLTRIRLILPDGAVRAFEFQGDPGFVRLDPTRSQTSAQFIVEGFKQMLKPPDLLLFLIAAVMPFRRVRDLVIVGVAFTLAHSLTLFASAFGIMPEVLWFPSLIHTLLACSLVYIGAENVIGATLKRRWQSAFVFGLAYGFSLALALGPALQLAAAHVMTARLAFNAGVELAQLMTLALVASALALLFRFAVPERVGVVVMSALVVHTGWHAMAARADILRQYQFGWPELTPAFLADVVRWMMVAVAGGGIVWLMRTLTKPEHPPAR